jgi:hypothetical protein
MSFNSKYVNQQNVPQGHNVEHYFNQKAASP